MLIAMSIAAAFCIFNGCFPRAFLYRILPFEVHYLPYTSSHVIAQVQILFFSALAFTWLKLTGLYPPELRSVNLDAEWTYRRALPWVWARMSHAWALTSGRLAERFGRPLTRTFERIYRHHGPQGIFARTWTAGSTVLWVAIVLSAFLLLFYL
jgi:multicomponent Na+:H+ antiporter subunit D